MDRRSEKLAGGQKNGQEKRGVQAEGRKGGRSVVRSLLRSEIGDIKNGLKIRNSTLKIRNC